MRFPCVSGSWRASCGVRALNARTRGQERGRRACRCPQARRSLPRGCWALERGGPRPRGRWGLERGGLCSWARLTLERGEPRPRGFKTPDFHRKSESLYHRDSPWISDYRVQNVSQINTQSHTSHHIRITIHEFITSPLRSTSIQASWLNQSEIFYAAVAIFSEGSPSLSFPPQANSSEATYPSVVPSVGVAVELGLVPCTPKVYPQGVG
jgi:hypothetical protein